MALVPDGEVALEETDSPRVVAVQRLFLDRYPVTNREYYEFVAAGGYQQMALWDESILPAVLDFVDRTDQPGPKYWENGCYPAGEERHPVVGVSWYEAAAYARWVGKRLPSDAEWVKAGCWPVPLVEHRPLPAALSLGRYDGPLESESLGFRAGPHRAGR